MNPGDPRDSALETLLSRRARPGPSTAGCLDAETMAAYAEGGLSRQALAEAEAHLASCAHCQTVMAAIVSSGEEAAAAPAIAPERAWWTQFRWLMPLAGAAAAAVLWMVVPAGRPARIQETAAPSTSEPRPQPSATAPAAPPDNRIQGIDQAAPQAAKKVGPDASNERAGQLADQNLRRERGGVDFPPRSNEAPGRAEADRVAKAEEREAPMPGAAPAAPPAEEQKAVDAARGAPPPAAPAAVSSLASSASPTELRSLDPSVRWRLVDLGFVERSTNAGASWDRVDTGVRTPLNAGACPTASTCWVVGDAGVVRRTTDARTWRPVTAPSAENLVSVEAASEVAAVVLATGGQRFSTSDGGATWTRVP